MLRKIYSIRDSAARCFTPPFVCITDGEALRAFTDAANSKSHYVGQHPGDYSLFRIGTFDDSTGVITPEAALHNLGLAVTLVRASGDDSPQLDLTKGN